MVFLDSLDIMVGCYVCCLVLASSGSFWCVRSFTSCSANKNLGMPYAMLEAVLELNYPHLSSNVTSKPALYLEAPDDLLEQLCEKYQQVVGTLDDVYANTSKDGVIRIPRGKLRLFTLLSWMESCGWNIYKCCVSDIAGDGIATKVHALVFVMHK